MNTAKDMLPAIGQSVAVRFEEILVNCTVRNVKSSYGRTRLLVTPTAGMGEQWVEIPRVSKPTQPSVNVTGVSKQIPQREEPQW